FFCTVFSSGYQVVTYFHFFFMSGFRCFLNWLSFSCLWSYCFFCLRCYWFFFFLGCFFSTRSKNTFDYNFRKILTVSVTFLVTFTSFLFENNDFVTFKVSGDFCSYLSSIYSRGA